jgi:hypothetical protein
LPKLVHLVSGMRVFLCCAHHSKDRTFHQVKTF